MHFITLPMPVPSPDFNKKRRVKCEENIATRSLIKASVF
jgi:hypothetical protein